MTTTWPKFQFGLGTTIFVACICGLFLFLNFDPDITLINGEGIVQVFEVVRVQKYGSPFPCYYIVEETRVLGIKDELVGMLPLSELPPIGSGVVIERTWNWKSALSNIAVLIIAIGVAIGFSESVIYSRFRAGGTG